LGDKDRGGLSSEESSPSAEEDAVGRRYMLGLYVSERAVSWPLDGGNRGSAFQTYSDIRRFYSDYIDHCRFNELCAVSRLNALNYVDITNTSWFIAAETVGALQFTSY